MHAKEINDFILYPKYLFDTVYTLYIQVIAVKSSYVISSQSFNQGLTRASHVCVWKMQFQHNTNSNKWKINKTLIYTNKVVNLYYS